MAKRKFPENSVCKPCWELKYCPYGHIVEHFPLYHESDRLEKFDTKERYQEVVKEIENKKHFSVGDIHNYSRLLDILNPDSNEYVAQFEPEDVACRIFGHTCPVFFAQSGASETKEGRVEGRHITRAVMLKVVRRDNHICQACNQYVRDDEIEFDHIIPVSKGGPTTVDNLKILCRSCNRKKSNSLAELLNV